MSSRLDLARRRASCKWMLGYWEAMAHRREVCLIHVRYQLRFHF